MRNYNYFCVAAEESSISAAAERLNITQQSLSSHIARLEKEFGVLLFERHPKLRLTLAGEQFYAYAKRAVEEEKEIRSMLNTSSVRIRLPIGIAASKEVYYLPLIFSDFYKKRPDVCLSIIHVGSSTHQKLLQDMAALATIGIGTPDMAKVNKIPLIQERSYALIPKQFLTADTLPSSITLDFILGYPITLPPTSSNFRKKIDKYCLQHNLHPQVILESTRPEVGAQISLQGYAASIITETILFKMIRDGRFSSDCRCFYLSTDIDFKPDNIELLHRTDIFIPDYLNTFIESTKSVCQDIENTMEKTVTEFFMKSQQ